jgi:hypothetical protein|nr:MAG TPA: hypothetical protein [Caudoviricetes sp.]
MQLIDTIFELSMGVFIAYCKLSLSFLCLCIVGFVPIALLMSGIEKVRRK